MQNRFNSSSFQSIPSSYGLWGRRRLRLFRRIRCLRVPVSASVTARLRGIIFRKRAAWGLPYSLERASIRSDETDHYLDFIDGSNSLLWRVRKPGTVSVFAGWQMRYRWQGLPKRLCATRKPGCNGRNLLSKPNLRFQLRLPCGAAGLF